MNNKANILVLDDEQVMLDVLSDLLKGEGYNVDFATTGKEALGKFRSNNYDLVIQDIMLPDVNGLEILKEIKKSSPDLPVIMITAYASVESAIQAMRIGAEEYLTKPFNNDEVLLKVSRALEQHRLMLDYKNLLFQRKERFSFPNIIGKSDKMIQILELVRQAAPSRSTVLIQGESGTGKELIAGAIHTYSNRADKPFTVVNSSTIPSELLEATLFGHTKGAFTGAITAKKGLFKAADGGTMFFDEIGNIGLDVQAKLLRVMQERSFIPIGSTETVHVDVRIIAATNINLQKAMQEGKFREDLFYRLNVINIRILPLRERLDDIPLLLAHFLQKYCEENNRDILEVKADALERLSSYHWPGNVRELENVIERAAVLAKSNKLTTDLLPDYITDHKMIHNPSIPFPVSGLSLKEEVQNLEKRLIKEALRVTNGVQKEAAKMLSLKPTTLHEMMKRLKIETEGYGLGE